VSVALSTLAARLTAAVPVKYGQPADYNQLVKDAIAQLSQDVPIVTSTDLAIVSGTASYTLPTDFLFVISLASLTAPGQGVIIGASLVPVPQSFSERYYIEGDQIRFVPTPTYTVARTLRYAACHVLNAAVVYPRLTENGARIAMLYAQHLALSAQAAVGGAAAWKYSIGDEMVDKSRAGTALMEQADGLLKQYQQAIRGLKGTGMRAQYDASTGEAI
jgi:hypothetical protein